MGSVVNCKSQRVSNSNRLTMLEALVTIGILSIAAMALMGVNVTAVKSNKSPSIRADLQDIKRTITNLIDCEQAPGAVKPTTCSGPVILKNRSGSPMVNSGKISDWTIESTCETIGTPSEPCSESGLFVLIRANIQLIYFTLV